MPLKDGKRGSLIFSVTETIAGSEASRPKTPSSVSRSPVILPSATTTLRSCVSCGMPRYSAMMAGTAPTRPSVASLPAMIRSAGSSFSKVICPRAAASVHAVWIASEPCSAGVVDVDGLVGAHRQSLADSVGGAVGTCGQHRYLTALSFLDEECFFDGALVDLVEDCVGGFTVKRVVAVGQLALGPCVGDLLDQNNDIRHGSSSTSCV